MIGHQFRANADQYSGDDAEFQVEQFAFHPFSQLGGLPQAVRVFGGEAAHGRAHRPPERTHVRRPRPKKAAPGRRRRRRAATRQPLTTSTPTHAPDARHAAVHRPDPRLPLRRRLPRPGQQRRAARRSCSSSTSSKASTPRTGCAPGC
ncbi:MAG: hypothetical protein MZU91_12225 [Desulfosudis oleivorans]|nr:hypothetical protein [Desulfosudis oleivorans]